jgi:hypothetical protein
MVREGEVLGFWDGNVLTRSLGRERDFETTRGQVRSKLAPGSEGSAAINHGSWTHVVVK